MDAEERFHNKRMEYVKYCIHVKTECSSPCDLHELDTEARISQRPDRGKKYARAEASSSSNTKMLKTKLKNR